MKEGICTAVGVVGSAIAAAFGGWDQALVTLVIFMVIDYLSGLIVAGIFHNSRKTENGALESRAGWKGLTENAGLMGIPLPTVVQNAIEVLTRKASVSKDGEQ